MCHWPWCQFKGHIFPFILMCVSGLIFLTHVLVSQLRSYFCRRDRIILLWSHVCSNVDSLQAYHSCCPYKSTSPSLRSPSQAGRSGKEPGNAPLTQCSYTLHYGITFVWAFWLQGHHQPEHHHEDRRPLCRPGPRRQRQR